MELKEFKEEVKIFRDERNWNQFHNPLDLSVAMSIECAEILELIRFKSREEVQTWISNPENKKEFSYEMADVFIFLLALANSTGIDLEQAFKEKLIINKEKYPIDKCHSKKDKYDKF